MSDAGGMRNPPPAWIGLGPPLAGVVLLLFRGSLLPAGLILLGAGAVVAILELVAALTRSSGAKTPELEPLSTAGVAMARLVSVAVASLQSMVAVAIGLGQPEVVGLMVAAGSLMVVMAVAIGVRRISAALAAIRAAGHGELIKGYGPILYRNKDDPRLWVPKLSSVGHTLNFAHPAAWWILALLVGFPVGLAAMALLTARGRSG
ncbi:MAG TPA: DUF5808 domain-containing protein [Myxococcales bacterium]|nr:DUF5808 domain-containing protein [Myxococcales bacterium]